MQKRRITTKEDIQYILGNLDKEASQIATELGMNYNVVIKIRNKHGIYNNKRVINEYNKAKIKELYKNHTVREIANELGLNFFTVRGCIVRNKFTQNKEFVHEQKLRQVKLMQTDEAKAKREKKRMLFYKMERLRAMSGLPTKSGYIIPLPKRVTKAKSLLRKYGYFDTDDRYVMGYDENTKRKEKKPYNEEYFINKYKLSFEYIND